MPAATPAPPTDTRPEPLWLGQYPVIPGDEDLLAASAGVHEFRYGKPREAAEAAAHADYAKALGVRAAAHHLLGVRAAHATGHLTAAAAHGEAYARAAHVVGFDPSKPPPPEVLDAVAAMTPKEHPVKFKAHPGDAMVQSYAGAPPEAEPAEREAGIRATLAKLQTLRATLQVPPAPVVKSEGGPGPADRPKSHKFGMAVPAGGAACSKCRFLEGEKTCGNPGYRAWAKTGSLPVAADRYCCDNFEGPPGGRDEWD